jgi:chemotaxis protein histidine kinase CheA
MADEIVREFLIESTENLDLLDRELITLEKDPGNRETLSSVFRTIHTIKGTCGFLGFTKLESVAHVGESLLSQLRDGDLTLNPESTTALLSLVDAIRQMLESIRTTETEGERDDRELIATLERLQVKKDKVQVTLPKVNALETKSPGHEPEGASKVGLNENGKVKNSTTEASTVLAGETVAKGALADASIRVGVVLLDRLMNLVGELVLARNQILQHSKVTESGGLVTASQRLNLITTELQEGVMKTRMQPIENIWSKFPRTVRDVAVSCGKKVRIEMEGKETELDKTIIESIKDPLTHLVRNAVDHGIEKPEDRVAAGKPAEGLLRLRAYHEGGQVNIEIVDDGAGLNVEKIKNKAVLKGLITAEQVARLNERELSNLIFLPGLSTADSVTNVSGRGVGMDVVKTNIEKIGGMVDVQSELGAGTTVKMKIPLTLAIIPALMVTNGGERYAIPQISLLELVRVEGEEAGKRIELIQGVPVYRLRGRLLPLVYLNRELNSSGAQQNASRPVLTAGLDFSLVRDKHREWIDRLQQVLNGKLALTAQEAGSHQTCALGRWIYSTGMKDYGSVADMNVLERVHKQFHGIVHTILEGKRSTDDPRTQQELANLAQTSHRIMELLSSIERSVLEMQNVNIVVLQADDRQFGLVVDEINDTEEIVVKPLAKQLKGIKAYAGATIRGDGRVALILDVLGIAQSSNVVSEVHAKALKEKEESASEAKETKQRLLLFAGPDDGYMAVPLENVGRLEVFPLSSVERAGNADVVQYRGEILPLLFMNEMLEERRSHFRRGTEKAATADADHLQGIVYSGGGKPVGLIIERILDIVEESIQVKSAATRPGVLYTAVIQGRVTEMLDMPALLHAFESNHSPGTQPERMEV